MHLMLSHSDLKIQNENIQFIYNISFSVHYDIGDK